MTVYGIEWPSMVALASNCVSIKIVLSTGARAGPGAGPWPYTVSGTGHGTPGHALPGYPHDYHPGYTTKVLRTTSVMQGAADWTKNGAMGSNRVPNRAGMTSRVDLSRTIWLFGLDLGTVLQESTEPEGPGLPRSIHSM